jgi:hypothetical protein
MTRPWVIGWVTLVPLLLGAGPPVVKSAAPAPELDALFDRADGWIGADGAYSVALSPQRTLWLFSETLSHGGVFPVDSLSRSCSGVILSTSHQRMPSGHGTPRRP